MENHWREIDQFRILRGGKILLAFIDVIWGLIDRGITHRIEIERILSHVGRLEKITGEIECREIVGINKIFSNFQNIIPIIICRDHQNANNIIDTMIRIGRITDTIIRLWDTQDTKINIRDTIDIKITIEDIQH